MMNRFFKLSLASLLAIFVLSGCAQKDLSYHLEENPGLADDDNDGVINMRDLCPETVKGAEINNDGCGEVRTYVVSVNLQLLFDNNSSEIKASYLPELASFAHAIKQSNDIKVELEGHASAIGRAEYNLALSQRRANSVMNTLIAEYGVDKTKLSAVAFGESKLVAKGSDETDHSLNRRVVAHIEINKQEDLLRWNIYSTENN
ncbi:OmpA family protein [Litorilituus sediminis]|uniref:OmpA family protein n=1 Tax=Litorilituus sediminis TaxID=718192 RepID=A0A4P6P6B9_9GAMM|nr:OmpA family protein [Litorilituus sediminis]QBG37053.1 OmpA family protein [Litorilituus sediminis]